MSTVLKFKSGLRPNPQRPIISIGTINVDQLMGPVTHWPDPGTETVYPDYEMRVGGGLGNFGAALKALGAHQHMVVNVGDDAMGDWLQGQFGALADHWHRSQTVTSVTIGMTHADKERTFLSNEGHSSVFDADMVRAMLRGIKLDGAIALVVGSFLMPRLLPDCADILAELRQAGAIVALDTAWPTGGWSNAVQAHLESWLGHVDVLLINDAEAAGILGISVADFDGDVDGALARIADKLHDDAIIVIKRGASGATAFSHGAITHVPVPEHVDVVDTVGAGDCFNAGFLMALQQNADLENALRAGIDVAGKAIASQPRRYPELSDLRTDVAATLAGGKNTPVQMHTQTFDQVENS
ncbi:carbohydrate kinase family protein [Thalassospira lucentensis]|uniref:carbohydrate kinase family protein n=1 Tax=Thalassospira lucentensis TaxID=168935 RepID=UPI00142E089C|nr:carbohydrate kinase family protein [Thalassospira lucentensis]NIZ01144.1 carbohydrate kinase family protein [Thalassospira lucentensis]